MDVCFRFLISPDEPIAVKVFAMTVAANICKHEPELKNELQLVIAEQMEKASAGFRARAKRIRKELKQ